MIITQKELENMPFNELLLFHSWFFGDDRAYMIAHILENDEYLTEENDKFTKEQRNDWEKINLASCEQCKICGEPLNGIIKVHHHYEHGVCGDDK